MDKPKKIILMATFMAMTAVSAIALAKPIDGAVNTLQPMRVAAPLPIKREIPAPQAVPVENPNVIFQGNDHAGTILLTGEQEKFSYQFTQASGEQACVVSTNAPFEPQATTPLLIQVTPKGFLIFRHNGIPLGPETIQFICVPTAS